jgi:transposase-like protein
MEDYPRTLLELERRFSTEEDCRQYLAALRWPDGFVCPRCGGQKGWPMARGLWLCGQCRHQCSVKAGTIFQDSRLPLTLWFRAMWYICSQKNGVSAMGVQRVLGFGSYQTAWAWLQKLRRAMVRPGRDRLRGRIEVDETYIGGRESAPGRGAISKSLVVIAAEEAGAGIGRIRLACIPAASREVLGAFIAGAIEPASAIHTDGWSGYDLLASQGYAHQVTKLKGKPADAAVVLLPRVHRVASLLQRWLLGTHQGAVSGEHLAYYLDEFTFRFNRRTSASRGKVFYRLVQQAVQVPPQPYKTLIRLQPMGPG